MNIKPVDATIKGLLKSGRSFIVPRFQRDYSWERRNNEEFIDDILRGIEMGNDKLVSTTYFLGTMLFIGNFLEKGTKPIQIVDGQQRITTITILFSVLSDLFRANNEDTLSKTIFEYVMTSDDDGQMFRVISSESSYPYFSFFIQDIEKAQPVTAASEEEMCIQETYNYFKQRLEENTLRKSLSEYLEGKDISNISYVEILKTIRDQVLNCVFVSISTDDEGSAYRIFEILNAKGKKLAYVDLIKNRLFEELQSTEPADIAKVKWNELKKNINECDVASVGLATFYRHFWSACYGQVSANRLYEKFDKTIKKTNYKEFLDNMVEYSRYYSKILKPNRADYNNRKEYFWLVQSLDVLSNWFGIAQVRVLLLSLFKVKAKDVISSEAFKTVILYLEHFHFAYTSIMSGKANKLDSLYSKTAVALGKSSNKAETNNILNKVLYPALEALFPSYEDFSAQFVKMQFTKASIPSNMKCKYALNKLYCYYQDRDVFDEAASVEHIMPEVQGDITMSIGNLILLEQKLNQEAGMMNYVGKQDVYQKSQYIWVHNFIKEHKDWNEDDISVRAEELAKIFYTDVLGRTIPNKVERFEFKLLPIN